VEELDRPDGPDAEIVDTNSFDTLAEAKQQAAHPLCKYSRIGLVRDVGEPLDGLHNRQWAYLDEDGDLPTYFDGGAVVPMRFLHELNKSRKS
jgi:hypothetical protein